MKTFLRMLFVVASAALIPACRSAEGTCSRSSDCAPEEFCSNGYCATADSLKDKNKNTADAGTSADAGTVPTSNCLPFDEPDDAFQDTNCDGIDGLAKDALFVSSSGNDANSGTQDAPFASVSKALDTAQSNPKRPLSIYIAQGSYEAPSQWVAGIHLYGGYDKSWARSAADTSRAELVTSSSGLFMSGFTQTVIFDRVNIRSNQSAVAGGPSQALRMLNCLSNVTLRYVKLTAGRGGAGANGAPGADGIDGLRGGDGEYSQLNKPDTCRSGGSAVGSGAEQSGRGGIGGCAGSWDGESGFRSWAGAAGGAGGKWDCAKSAADGSPGYNGDNGKDGQPGWSFDKRSIGEISKSQVLWVPDLLMKGYPGGIGYSGTAAGGGGGGGKLQCLPFGPYEAGGGGGGGGSGGKGGSGGEGGEAGGASIALSLVNSSPFLHHVKLESSAGGAGGQGGAGGRGGKGGAAGQGGLGVKFDDRRTGNGGWGGSGGNGGSGGKGEDGLPGPSVGVWCGDFSSTPIYQGEVGYPTFAGALPKVGCP